MRTRLRITQTFALEHTHPSDDPLLSLTSMVAGCAPCELARAQGAGQFATPDPEAGDAPDQPDGPTSDVQSVGWSGVIGVEGEVTGDGRMIEVNALRWENLPIPLRYVPVDTGGHDGAMVVGRIDTITRNSNGNLDATGTLDGGSPAGEEAIRQVGENLTNGVSMDLDDVSFEVRIAGELLEGDGFFPMFLATETLHDEEPPAPETDDEGRVTVMEINADDEVRVTTDGRIRAATIVAIPAFATAQIALTGETQTAAVASADATALSPVGATAEALVAAAAPVSPPAEWFNAPTFDSATALTVTDEGRIFGHLAAWNTCHVAHSHNGCVRPPRSRTGYAYFHTGSLVAANGAEIAVGRITLNTRHAGPTLSQAAAATHYEQTGSVVADVRAGEDAHGIWVAGALRPGITPEQVRELRAAPLSGDWRGVAGNLELVAALAVNVAGFPIPRPSGLVAGGAVQSMVASGLVPPRRVRRPGLPGSLSMDDLRYLKRLADRERRDEALAALGDLPDPATLAARVRATSFAMRVRHPELTRGGQ